MFGSAHANRIATRRNELQTFLVDTTHVQGHSTFTQQVTQMLCASKLSHLKWGWAGGGGAIRRGKNLADLASHGKFDHVSRML